MKKIYVISPHKEERNEFINTHFSELMKLSRETIISLDKIDSFKDDYEFIYILLKDTDLEEWELYTRIKIENSRIIRLNED